MILTNEFYVPAPVQEAWPVLVDIPRVARCLPGAHLESSEGALHRGRMSAKIGPISATYAGTATVVDVDDDTHTVVLQLDAREARGQGMASATLTLQMAPAREGSHIAVKTDLKMTGAHAQFGRGILQSVAGKMIGTFAANLEAEIADGSAGTGHATTQPAPALATAGAGAGTGAGTLDLASLLPMPSASSLAKLTGSLLAGMLVGTLWARRGSSGRVPLTIHVHVAPGGDAS